MLKESSRIYFINARAFVCNHPDTQEPVLVQRNGKLTKEEISSILNKCDMQLISDIPITTDPYTFYELRG